MIKDLEISGYRSFAALRIENLMRTNVFVGKNNAGKTSVLEALEFFFLRDQPAALLRSSWRRQEVYVENRGTQKTSPKTMLLDARQLFHGREMGPESLFSIEATTGSSLKRRRVTTFVQTISSDRRRSLRLSSKNVLTVNVGPNAPRHHYPLIENALEVEVSSRNAPDALIRPYIFSGPDRLGPSEQAHLWNFVVGNEDEDFVTDALRMIEPTLERILFTVGDRYTSPAAFVRLTGQSERIPLGNLGHGASRLFELALFMVLARGGALFIDEIEVGLHHLVMQPVWQLILTTAERLDVQVFVATHSRDSLEALAALYRENDELLNAVNLYRLHAGASTPEQFSMSDLETAEQANLELRGIL